MNHYQDAESRFTPVIPHSNITAGYSVLSVLNAELSVLATKIMPTKKTVVFIACDSGNSPMYI